MARVLVPIAQGCEELEAVTIIDLLRRADVEVVVQVRRHHVADRTSSGELLAQPVVQSHRPVQPQAAVVEAHHGHARADLEPDPGYAEAAVDQTRGQVARRGSNVGVATSSRAVCVLARHYSTRLRSPRRKDPRLQPRISG